MGFFDKLKKGLFKTKDAIVGKIDNLFKKFVKVDEDLFDELEELLISADIGVTTTEEILDELRDSVKENRIKEPEEVKAELLSILKRMVGEHEPLKLDTKPSVILVIGVNGVGKTTSIGKIAAEFFKIGIEHFPIERRKAAYRQSAFDGKIGTQLILRVFGDSRHQNTKPLRPR